MNKVVSLVLTENKSQVKKVQQRLDTQIQRNEARNSH